MAKTNNKLDNFFMKNILFLVFLFIVSLLVFPGCNATKNTVRLYTCAGDTYTVYSKTGYKKSKQRIKFLKRYHKIPKSKH